MGSPTRLRRETVTRSPACTSFRIPAQRRNADTAPLTSASWPTPFLAGPMAWSWSVTCHLPAPAGRRERRSTGTASAAHTVRLHPDHTVGWLRSRGTHRAKAVNQRYLCLMCPSWRTGADQKPWPGNPEHPFCADRQPSEVPSPPAPNGRSARGYYEPGTSLTAERSPATVRRTVGWAVFLYIGADVGNSLFCREEVRILAAAERLRRHPPQHLGLSQLPRRCPTWALGHWGRLTPRIRTVMGASGCRNGRVLPLFFQSRADGRV
jgi:hypothetical protein